jgi:hypothetical protein
MRQSVSGNGAVLASLHTFRYTLCQHYFFLQKIDLCYKVLQISKNQVSKVANLNQGDQIGRKRPMGDCLLWSVF